MRTRDLWAKAAWPIAAGLIAGPIAGIAVAEPLPADPDQQHNAAPARPGDGSHGAAERVIEGLKDGALQDLLHEVLALNPDLRQVEHMVASREVTARIAGTLSDPMLSATVFPAGPQTRTGEQVFAIEARQDLPWKGSLAIERGAAAARARSADATRETLALALITEARQLVLDVARADARARVLKELRTHLEHHEEIARSQYATGVGGSQQVIKLQAEISMVGTDLLTVETARTSALSQLNALRDRPASTPVEVPLLVASGAAGKERDEEAALANASLSCRPDLLALEAVSEVAAAEVEAERLRQKPGFFVGLGYTIVDRRDDPAGLANPPLDDGDDVIALRGGMTLPLYSQVRAGRVEAAEAERRATVAAEDSAERQARSEVEELAALLPLQSERLRQIRDLVTVQAQEAMRSAQAGYVAGTMSALDLLHAAHRLFDARLEAVDAEIDLRRTEARLEGALGVPLHEIETAKECGS